MILEVKILQGGFDWEISQADRRMGFNSQVIRETRKYYFNFDP